MNTFNLMDLLDRQQTADIETEKRLIAKNDGLFATFCMECEKNTHVGSHPRWHAYARTLCDNCGRTYEAELKSLGAWDT